MGGKTKPKWGYYDIIWKLYSLSPLFPRYSFCSLAFLLDKDQEINAWKSEAGTSKSRSSLRATIVHNSSEDGRNIGRASPSSYWLPWMLSSHPDTTQEKEGKISGEKLLFLWVWTSFNWLVANLRWLNNYPRETTSSQERMSWPHTWILSTITGKK